MIKRYFKLLLQLVRNNIVLEMEYRVKFIISMLTSIYWVVFQLFLIELFFGYTNNLFGWNKAELFLFTGLFRLSKSLFDIFVRRNFFEFSENVNQGLLDFILTKPVNPLFLCSVRRHKYANIPDLIIGTAVCFYVFNLMGVSISLATVFSLLLMVITGFVAYYSIFLLIVPLAIFMTRLTAISDLNNVFANMLRYPTTTISRDNLVANLFLLPVAIVATLPIMIFLRKGGFLLILVELILVSVIFLRQFLFGILR
jgi:ABC-2 type transport system permease protein